MTIAARDGFSLPARLYAAEVAGNCRRPLLLYFHGGGFVVGNIATHDTLCRELARQGSCMVVSVGYRLAPEHRFPTAVDDAWDALAWLRRQAPELGGDADRMAVGGDSAGGTLAAVCAIHARNAGWRLVLQLLIYPGCGAYPDTLSHRRFQAGPVLDRALLDWFSDQYLRGPADRNDWRFAPLLAADLDGLAPAWLGLAECDPLVDEGIAYADRLRMAGVAVDLEIYRGVVHEFVKMGRALPEARQAHADAGAALRQAFQEIE
jgi:acetyl esterase